MARRSKSSKVDSHKEHNDHSDSEVQNSHNNKSSNSHNDHGNASSNDSSDDEDEDDFGDLITEDVEDGINKVLSAIKNNDPSLFNPEVRFFNDADKEGNKIVNEKLSNKSKPVFLKDYQRERLLNGELNVEDDEDEEHEREDNNPVKTYAQEQEEDRQGILSEINKVFDTKDASSKKNDSDKENSEDDEDDDDDFMKKKTKKTSLKKVEDYLPDPEKEGEEEFLSEFMEKQAWIPKKKTEKGEIVLDVDGQVIDNADDDDDDVEEEKNNEFEDAVENFEKVYNFRYEDPTAAEIVSYARTQATLRRSETSSRRTKRDSLKQEKLKEEDTKLKALQKKKKQKVIKINDFIMNLEKEYGSKVQKDPKIVEKLSNILINKDTEYDQDQWDQVLSELFAEQGEEEDEEEGHEGMEKPTWDDEIMDDFNNSKKTPEEDSSNGTTTTSKTISKRKSKLEAKREGKKSKKNLQDIIENVVDDNKLALMDEVEEERKSRSKTKDTDSVVFKYREVSPDSYGLSYREIFAADDESLNKYINLKKFAPYRPKNLRDKDRRKVTKSKRIAEWRKEVFNDKNGPADDFNMNYQEEQEEKHSKHDHKHKKRKISKK